MQEFRNGWRTCLNYLITSWQIVDDCSQTLHNNSLANKTIELHADRFPLLQSAQALTELLQLACDQTALWLHDTIARARDNVVDSGYISSLYVPYNSAHLRVDPFRCTARQNTNGLPVIYENMVLEYVVMVTEWNTL